MVGDENEAQTTYESESEGLTHVKSSNSQSRMEFDQSVSNFKNDNQFGLQDIYNVKGHNKDHIVVKRN